MRKRGKWPFSRPVLVCLLGLLLGIGFSFLIRSLKNAHRHANLPKCFLTEAQIRPKEPQLLLVGVMTAAKYVDTRAYNVWKTWAKSIPGKVLFFVSENTVSQHKDMPLIRLKGVNDDYPPQKKSFAMLRWFFDNQLENFHWFLRADDDLYVRGEKLDQFLRSLDPNKAHLIGQAGLGNTAEYGQLSLGPQDNYCMGGPGVVLSREALRSVAGHLENCLANLLTTHEDVEVGRCLRKHVGIACTWNYEMQTLFHNNQTVPNVYDNGNLEELRHAITLHPIKKPEVMKKIHVHALSLRLNELRAKRMTLQRDLKRATQHSLNRRFTNTTTDVQNWDYMSGHISFCANQVNCPRHTTDVNMMAAVNEIIVQLFDDFNANARQRGRILQFQNTQYSYARVEPRHGVDYVLDMILWFKKFRPPHRATLSVRRHAYVQQTFGPIETITDRKFRQKLSKRNHIAEDDGLSSTDSTIYLIVPLKGRPSTFQRFSDNLLSVIPPQEKKVEIVLVFYKSENETDDNIIKNSIFELSHILPVHVIDMTNKSFNRGQALTAGTAILPTNALLFFIDVDMIFKYDTLERIRLNTIMGVQAYFPIVFSEFSRHSWSSLDRDEQRHFSYNRRRGYFRHFGFGIASIYKQDFDAVGGFGNFEGWGLEDVDLFEKCISSHLRVLRAPDQLVHVYHSIKCPSTMPTKQRNMCIGSKTASLASLDSLAEQISLYT